MKGVVHAMLVAKMKLAAAACAAVMVGGVVTGATIQQITAPLSAPVVTSTTLALTAEAEPLKATADKTEVEVLGLARWGAEASGWWAPDGSKTEDPRALRGRTAPPASGDHAPGDAARVWRQSKRRLLGPHPAGQQSEHVRPHTLAGRGVSAGALCGGEGSKDCGHRSTPGRRGMEDGWNFRARARPAAGRSRNGIRRHRADAPDRRPRRGIDPLRGHDIKGPQFEPFVTDAQGTEHRCDTMNGGDVGKFAAIRFEWRLPPEEVSGVVLKVRPFNKRVIAKNVSLDPAHPTKPQIAVETIEPKK